MTKAFWAFGALLILAGSLTLIHPDVHYATRRQWVNQGPCRAQVETTRQVRFPRTLGAATVAAGIVLIAAGRMNRHC